MIKSKKRMSVLLSAMLAVSNIGINTRYSFSQEDIQNHWAKDTLTKWKMQGYLRGDEKGNINPDKHVTRAEFVTIINNIMGYTSKGENISAFVDVKKDAWYYEQISTAFSQGYIKGTGPDTMEPDKNISRQEVMVILNNIAGLENGDFDLSEVEDKDKIAPWAKDAVLNMIKNGYISGYNKNINPDKAMTRAESVVLLDDYKENNRTIAFSGEYSFGDINNLRVLTADIKIKNSNIKQLIIEEELKGRLELYNVNIDKIINKSSDIEIFADGQRAVVENGTLKKQDISNNVKYKDGVFEGTATGYSSQVKVKLTIKDGKIDKIDVEQNETPIYWNLAKKVIDKIIEKQDAKVDVSSGATISSNAIMLAVEEALKSALIQEEAKLMPKESYNDGTYTGESNGFRGVVKVSVTVKDKRIEKVELLSHSDDSNYMNSATNLLSKIVEKQTASIDVMSGATYSSNGILNAVKDALEQAKGKTNASGKSSYAALGGGGSSGGERALPQVNTIDFSNLKDGNYEGEAQGYSTTQPIRVRVVVSGGLIKEITLVQHLESAGYFDENRAKILSDRIIQQKTSKIDTISGATVSSNGFINAVINALNGADTPLIISSNTDSSEKYQDEEGKTYNNIIINGSGTRNTAPNVKLANVNVNEDIIIKDTMNEGSVRLENVKISGNLIVQGGGQDSIYLINSDINNVIIDKQLGKRVRIVIDSTSKINKKLTVNSPIILKSTSSNKISNVEISEKLGNNYQTLIEAVIGTLDIKTSTADIIIEDNAAIDNLILPNTVDKFESSKKVYTNADGSFKLEIKTSAKVNTGTNNNVSNKVLYGDANVDQIKYPSVSPFIHPPFYNIRVKVVVGTDNRVIAVSNDETEVKGLPNGVTTAQWSRHQSYWNKMVEGKIFDKFTGKSLEEIKAMKMDTGEADVITGATANSLAMKEAVINAFEGRKGRMFLQNSQTLTALSKEYNKGTKSISFINTLPSDFKLSLLNVSHGVYNGEAIVSGVVLSEDGSTLSIPSDLKAGHYYVNIIDDSKVYRSPDFEGGLGEAGHYPYFVIKSTAALGFDNTAKKLTVSDGDLDNVYKNVSKILIKDKELIGTKVAGRGGAMVDYSGTSLQTIGHHGTLGTKASVLFDENDGKINANLKTGANQTPVFTNGKEYQIEVYAFGYETLIFDYKADDTDKILYGESNVDQIDYPVIKYFIHPPFFNARVKVVLANDSKIVSVSDDDTSTKGLSPNADQNRWNNRNKAYWDMMFVKDANKNNTNIFDRFVGKTLAEVEAMDMQTGGADVVSGATANSIAVKEAVINAIRGKKGLKFIDDNQTLTVTTDSILSTSSSVLFVNTLPSDYEAELIGVVSGVYNSKTGDVVSSLNSSATELTIPTGLKYGHYFVNIRDSKNLYRSPDFEGGLGKKGHYPHFIIKSDVTLSYDAHNKKITASDGDIANLIKNIEEILVKDKSLIGTKVSSRTGALVDYNGTALRPMGNHGTADKNVAAFIDSYGNINAAYKSGNTNLFNAGVEYQVEVYVFGIEEPLIFDFSL